MTTVPQLTEWVTCTEAAHELGISRQSVNRMVQDGKFETLHALGGAERPLYVIRREEITKLAAARHG